MPLDGNKPEASVAWLSALLQGRRDMLQAARTTDCDYPISLIDGSGDLLGADVFERMEPMFAKYEADADMIALLTCAAEGYCDAATAAVYWAFAADANTHGRRKQELM